MLNDLPEVCLSISISISLFRLDEDTCKRFLAQSETFLSADADANSDGGRSLVESEIHAPSVTTIASNPAITGPRPKR